jgi:hypothetical protein
MKLKWPKVGDKLKTHQTFPKFFYPHFIDMVKDGNENLEPEKEYTVKRREVYSSWCAVWLEELPSTKERPDRFFNLGFFEWNADALEEESVTPVEVSYIEICQKSSG